MRIALFLAAAAVLAHPVAFAEEFECADKQAKKLNESISKAYGEYRDEPDKLTEALKGIVAEATRPEDRYVLLEACSSLVSVLDDLGDVSASAPELAGCPQDHVAMRIAIMESGDRAYGEDPVLPVLRIGPEYPKDAWDQGLSGWVIVEFTVTKKGVVKSPVVVESSNELFENNALEVIRKFRYQKRKNGTPGVRDRLVFDYFDRAYMKKCGFI